MGGPREKNAMDVLLHYDTILQKAAHPVVQGSSIMAQQLDLGVYHPRLVCD